MLGGKACNLRSKTGKKWTITKKELEAVLEFAEESQRFISRERREEDPQLTASTATRLIESDLPSSL
jgi:hypothetical protein